ncbi:DUF5954 family protein [Streptomyces sp. NPDC091272]|uniref:DUF5954 family protein n=1 Tax=Streptomyces sp. NPDC091272 TaxID=3365981 RepID=UPI0037FCAF53
MSQENAEPVGSPVAVRLPVEPVEAAIEADALDAVQQNGILGVRGPVFGVAVQEAADGRCWRVVSEVTAGCPQQARDALNSLLWIKAKDDAPDKAQRRALLAAVARLERERVDELTVLGARYRIVRAEEYVALDANGDIEMPRPTDPEPLHPDWTRGAKGPRPDEGLLLDADAPLTPALAVERLSLRDLAYRGTVRFPAAVIHDSLQALESHPDVLLLPATFAIVERNHTDTAWTPGSSLHATAHDARRTLDFSLVWMEPRRRGLLPLHGEHKSDARTVVAEGTHPKLPELTVYAEAADRLRAGRLNQIEVNGAVSRIGRIRRLLRWGPDGPEGPRPSDVNSQDPSQIRPHLDEDGVIHYDDEDTASPE